MSAEPPLTAHGNSPVLLTRGDISVRGYRMGRYGGVFVDDKKGVMNLPRDKFSGSAVWSSSPGGPMRFAELSDDRWNELGWSISAIPEEGE